VDLRLCIARLIRRLLVWALLGVTAASAQGLEAQQTAPLSLHAFELEMPDGRWQAVSLPLRWGPGVPGVPRRWHVRASFELDQAPQQMWAVMAERLPPDRQVLLNGRLLDGMRLQPAAALRRFSLLPQWLDVPPSLLHAGHNELDLTLELNHRVGGLSELRLGPAAALRPEFTSLSGWTVKLPQALNTAAAGLALFSLLIWWVRRSERVLGYFGALWLLVSLRNIAYYVPGGGLPPVLGEYLFFAAQVGSAPLLLGFALALARRPWPWPVSRLAWGLALSLGLGAWAAWQDRMGLARLLGYPVLLGLLAWAGWRVWGSLRELSTRARWAAALGLTLLLLSALHDYLLVAGSPLAGAALPVWGTIMGTFWIPFVSPVILLVAARELLLRFARAMDMAEQQGQVLERRVADRTRELQAANAAKTRFVAAASHDLRQPVASIGLLAGLLRDQVSGSGAKAVLDRLIESVLALESLLKGLLDLSRFEAGSVQTRPQAVQLQGLFDAVLTHEREAAALKGLRLRLRGGQHVVQADPVLLEQILRNLVANAVRYTDAGGVLVGARRRGDGVLLQVWDTGCGIAAEQQATVFEEFVQLDNPARERHRGLGLGLSLVRRAAQRMAVPLSLVSQPGRGSCFGLILPAAVLPPQARAQDAAPRDAALWSGREVLLVDDDAGVREAMRLQLLQWGVRVTACASLAEVHALLDGPGAQAVPALDLLLSDQRLPDGTAQDVAACLHVRQPGVPVLIITGDTAPADLARLARTGFQVLHKPFSAAALLAALPALHPKA
jgi:signal transduction histidine kinase/ActR/RegA family two-component response regulator